MSNYLPGTVFRSTDFDAVYVKVDKNTYDATYQSGFTQRLDARTVEVWHTLVHAVVDEKPTRHPVGTVIADRSGVTVMIKIDENTYRRFYGGKQSSDIGWEIELSTSIFHVVDLKK